jgi:hypothetical protein
MTAKIEVSGFQHVTATTSRRPRHLTGHSLMQLSEDDETLEVAVANL